MLETVSHRKDVVWYKLFVNQDTRTIQLNEAVAKDNKNLEHNCRSKVEFTDEITVPHKTFLIRVSNIQYKLDCHLG